MWGLLVAAALTALLHERRIQLREHIHFLFLFRLISIVLLVRLVFVKVSDSLSKALRPHELLAHLRITLTSCSLFYFIFHR